MRMTTWMLAAAVSAAGLAPACDADAQIVINEICASPARDWNQDGAVSARDDEWVEIYNAGGTEVVLDGYRIADLDTTWRMGLTGTLLPHSHLTIYGSQSLAWEKATHHTASGLSLNNSGDTVRLWKFTGADSAQVDAYTYNTAEGASDRTVGRFPDGSITWKIFDALNPIPQGGNPPGTGCAPSPSSPNGCPTAAKQISWSDLRHWFLDDHDGGPKPGRVAGMGRQK